MPLCLYISRGYFLKQLLYIPNYRDTTLFFYPPIYKCRLQFHNVTLYPLQSKGDKLVQFLNVLTSHKGIHSTTLLKLLSNSTKWYNPPITFTE